MGIENLDVKKSKTRLLKTPAWKALLEEAAADMDGDGAAEPHSSCVFVVWKAAQVGPVP